MNTELETRLRTALANSEPWATSLAREKKDYRPGSAHQFLSNEELLPHLEETVKKMAVRIQEQSGESEPQGWPDDADHKQVLTYLRYCASRWSPDARLVGNLRAGSIVKAIDALFQPDEETMAKVVDHLFPKKVKLGKWMNRGNQIVTVSSRIANGWYVEADPRPDYTVNDQGIAFTNGKQSDYDLMEPVDG